VIQARVPDPRPPYGGRPDRATLPLVGLRRFSVAALLRGCRNLYALAQWGCASATPEY
jgi:hypothetical protein